MTVTAGSCPIVEPLSPGLTPSAALERCWDLPYVCLLESALPVPGLGRYSFLVADPFETLRISRPRADALGELSRALQSYATPTVPDLPPFQGGAAGFLGYELGGCFERVSPSRHDEFSLPLAMLGLYDVVMAWDHEKGENWIISQGLPEKDPMARHRRATERLHQFQERLRGGPIPRSKTLFNLHATAHGLTAPQHVTRLGPAWIGNFDSHGYRSAVQQAIDYIHAGDVFQVNIAQRLMRRATANSIDLYLNLREVNAAPFAGYMDLGNAQVISASPERFLKVGDRIIQSRPIKGTRKRTHDATHDEEIARELQASEKDRAENTMIVDLIRNDLSRVCEATSISVPQWCEVEAFPHVLHLVSVVEGRLKEGATLCELISATFPGGSISGAPKVRAMEIISELEPTVRGPYCGSLGYMGFDGTMDLNILIRTITASCGWWQFQVGGGIVADSRPESEEEETWTKAAGLIAAISRV